MASPELQNTIPKPEFVDLDQPYERRMYETLRSCFRMYIIGVGVKHGGNEPLGEKLIWESATALRMGGQLLASAFQLRVENIAEITEMIAQDEGYSPLPGTRSFIAGRFAEGLYEDGETELARSVLDEVVNHPDAKPEIEQYFHFCDEGLIREQHV